MRMKRLLCCLLTAMLLTGSLAFAADTAAPAVEPAPEVTAEPVPAAEPTTPPAPSPVPEAASAPAPEGKAEPEPTAAPKAVPTAEPTVSPTPSPVPQVTAVPTQEPTPEPTHEVTPAPASHTEPTPEHTEAPTATVEAESTPPTAAPTASPTFAQTEETPAPTTSPTPAITESVPPSPTPTTPPTAEPPQEPDFVPTQDAWTRFADQTYFEGSVETVLREAQERGEHPAIYVRTHQQVTVTKVAQSYIDCLTPDPDVFVDGEHGSVYRVVYEVSEQTSEDTPPPVTLRVVDIHRQARKTDTPTPAVPNEETPAPPATEETPSPSASPTPLPTITVAFTLPPETPEPPQATDQPQEQAEIAEDVQAWMRYSTGTLVQGTAQAVLDSIGFDESATGELPTVYIRARDTVRLENIAESFLRRVPLLPDADVFAQEGEAVVRWKVAEGVARGLPPIELWVELLPPPTPPPEVPVLTVTARDYLPNAWSRVAPTFTLSGIEDGSTEYVYGVFICNEQLIVFSRGTTEYIPTLEGGDIRLRFAILDMMGDVVCFSDEYAMMLDMTPPDGPYPVPYNDSNTIVQVYASDSLSGLEAISLDGGNTWLSAELSEDHFRCQGEKGETLPGGCLQARDFAGNLSKCYEEYAFGRPRRPGNGSGSTTTPIRHASQTLDYSQANYNALELSFSDESQTQLIAGDTILNLNLTVDGQPGSFTVQTLTYPMEEGVLPSTPNLLMLTAQNQENAACAWQFSGDVYRLLYNSRVDFLVLRTGGYIAVLPTAGFTAGTEYVRLKSNGISTRRFLYTITQDEAMLETTMMVTVEEQTYELGEAKSRPMYRTGVLIGPMSLLDRPYRSYVEQ